MIAIFAHFFRHMARDRGLITQSAMFFGLSMLIIVFSIGSEEVLLTAILPTLIWAIILLSSLLGLTDLLDNNDLDDLILSNKPLPLLMLTKILAHWVATGLPIAIISPILLSMLVPNANLLMPALWLGLLPGTLAFSCIGLLGSALTLGSRKNAALQAIIVLPLSVPPLIFGAGAVSAAQIFMNWHSPIAFVAAFACVSLTLSPFAASWIIRMKGAQ